MSAPDRSPMIRLSESPAWAMQKRRYCGVQGWESGALPSFMSSNAFVARKYAEVIRGLGQDLPSSGEPLTILELGSGTGRLAFLILRELGRICSERGWPLTRFRYWLTDIAPETLAVWERSGRFAEYVSAGVADFALLDLDEPASAVIPRTGQPLDLTALKGGLVVIANYMVDSTRQDVFTLSDGILHELQVGMVMPEGVSLDHLARARFESADVPVERPYDDPGLAQLLAGYQARFADAWFTIPVAFLSAVRQFARLVPAPIVWLLGDYGYWSDDEIRAQGRKRPARHGEFFSLPVNFDALCRYVTQMGGGWLGAPDWSLKFTIAALFTGGTPASLPFAREAFKAAHEWPGAREVRRLLKAVGGAKDLNPEYAVDALRLSNYDPVVFAELYPHFRRLASDREPRFQAVLNAALDAVRHRLYPVATRTDVCYQLAVTYAAAGRVTEATEMFRQSIRERGESFRRLVAWALCEAERGETRQAQELALRAQGLEPANEGVAALLAELSGNGAATRHPVDRRLTFDTRHRRWSRGRRWSVW